MSLNIKQEMGEPSKLAENKGGVIISISSSSSSYRSSDSDLDSDFSDIESNPKKKQRVEDVLPVGFLDPLPPQERLAIQQQTVATGINGVNTDNAGHENKGSVSGKELAIREVKEVPIQSSKQFWKAGDYEGSSGGDSDLSTVGMDHVRVHPKFLHSNATSHKWALGAFAELLDNALDEVCNGATYVHIDMLRDKKYNSKMLLIEDDGGGMTPEKMRQCMSLGYSEKSKMANTIGQYGNGFKTSTMRLGADVIVFSRCQGKDGRSPTRSIGMLSYTFLRKTRKEDIVVPMIDYVKRGESWHMMERFSPHDWIRNLETILRWSPYESEEDLLQQFASLKDQGTRIIIYNLWEDDQGAPELDFETDEHDIQIRGVSRDEKKIEMAKNYPNSTHFLTYRHSLRSYASILYLRVPSSFRMILRGKGVEHHNLVNDMMLTQEITYKPSQNTGDEAPKDPNMVAVVTIGFVKDAKYHIDIQGFNVYHKNRLIKPFWRVWNAAGSDGRGVIGVLEANFVEPAHDKQGFERTIVLSRLESRLVNMQKRYWQSKCHLIGYAKRGKKNSVSPEKEVSPIANDKSCQKSNPTVPVKNGASNTKSNSKRVSRPLPANATENMPAAPQSHKKVSPMQQRLQMEFRANSETEDSAEVRLKACSSMTDIVNKLREENRSLRKRLEDMLQDLQYERDRSKSLENQLQELKEKSKQMDKEQEEFVTAFLEERTRRDAEEENFRKKLKEASDTISELVSRVKQLNSREVQTCKIEK